jgi:hypothetical protein
MDKVFWVAIPLALAGLATIAWQSPAFYAEVVSKWLSRAGICVAVFALIWNQAVYFVFGKLISSNDAAAIQQIQTAKAAAEIPGDWWLGMLLFAGYCALLMGLSLAKIKHDSAQR